MRYTGTNTTLLAFEASGDYNNDDNFTNTQKEAILGVVDKYKFIEGNYETTMIQGVGHAYCDSGIISDAWAEEDVEILSKYLRDTVADDEDEESVFYGTDIVHTVGDDIINVHTEGKRTHMWHNLFIADMEEALNIDDIEEWASYAWDLESYMYENK